MFLPRLHRIRPVPSLVAAAVLAGFAHASAVLPRPLFKHAVGSAPDTLEVFVLYVEFAQEPDGNDEPATTGNGTFGSDKDISYTLDPNGRSKRLSKFYLQRHFDFAQNYFNKVSNGRVVIIPRFFPAPVDDQISPRQLPHHMKSYNPALGDSPKQKTKDFEAQQAQALMSFVSLTAGLFDDPKDPANNPFLVAHLEDSLNPSPLRHHAFLIFHAGASRLIDGGSLGPLGANTPNDFLDFFVTKDDFKALDSATDTYLPTGTLVPAQRKDSLGVAVVTVPKDTINQFMMLSEQATQDKTNWGINGILINQLARQMGMPDLFDVVQGISQVGFFDVMDFAGYNTLSGFLPVFPSAWTRAFMGWDDPVTADHGAAAVDFKLQAADQPGPGLTRTVKIPLNEREYLLVENRQRAAGDTTVTVTFAKPHDATDFRYTDTGSVTVPYAFLDSLFLDSLCVELKNGVCSKQGVNPKKPSGIITGASHYDLGLPGNGLLVWHVNEWFLESFLKFDAVNAFLGDTLKAQYKGLELVEADGIPSIGKQFTDPLGQPAFDYGTAEDLLPHVFRKRKNPPRDTSWAAPESVTVIGSYGFANTNSWNDGRTHIQLSARWPSQSLLSRGIGGFTGDSVFNLRDSSITLRVEWPHDSTVAQAPGAAWPVHTWPASNPQALNLLRDNARGGPYVVSLADTGALQTYTGAGQLALAARDTVRDTDSYDSVTSPLASGNTRPDNAAGVNSLVDPDGKPIGACVASDSVLAVLTTRSLRFIKPSADSLKGTSKNGGSAIAYTLRGQAGPIFWGGKFFTVDSQSVLRAYDLNGAATDSISLPSRAYHSLAGLSFGSNSDPQIVAVGAGGAAVRVDVSARQAVDLKPAWGSLKPGDGEFFHAVVSDFDRDGSDDVFLLGSKGSALLLNTRADKAGQVFAGFPQVLPRSISIYDTATKKTYATEDRSPPALADLNGDGHPDLVFSGTNSVYALDWHGAVLTGWPFLPAGKQNVGFTYGNRRFPETVIGSMPLVVSLRGQPTVLLGSPDGLIYAIDKLGKPVAYSSFTSGLNTGLLMADHSDWPLSVGGISLDSNRSPYLQPALGQLDSGDLELLAQTATGSLNVWSLRDAAAKPGQAWLMPGGDAARSQHLDASALGSVIDPALSESIQEFHLFPSPVRDGLATVHLKLGAPASKVRIRLFDLAGNPVKDETLSDLTAGLQPFNHVIDLRRLGPDVYSVLCEAWFAGSKQSKWQRIGVVR